MKSSNQISSSASKHREIIPLHLAPSTSSGSGWTAINRARSSPKSPCRVEKPKKTKHQQKTIGTTNIRQEQTNVPRSRSAAEPSDDLTSNERHRWEQEFDRVLHSVDLEDDLPELPIFPHGSTSEDDLPALSDVPDLARTDSKTPLRSSTCPPTPRSHSTRVLGSKTGSQLPAVVILDSEEDEDNEDLMSGIEQHEFECIPRQIEHRARAHSSVSVYNPDVPSRPDIRVPTHYDPSIRSRRNWPSWAENWNRARLRRREGRRRYHEAHPNNHWLLREIDEVHEVDAQDGSDSDSVLQSIEHDYDPDEYDVERVMGERRRQRTHEFLVQWVGWEEMDWISSKNCFCPDLIEEFRSAQRARRANLLAMPVDGQESEAESLQQLADAARISAEHGNLPNPSRLRHRDKKGRFAKKVIRRNALIEEPVPMEIDDNQPAHSSDDEEFGTPRSRIQKSNTAIRSRSRHQSVFWHTPQEKQDGEILWVRSRTVTPDSPETLAGDPESLDLESVIEDNDDSEYTEGMEEDTEEDMDKDMEAWRFTLTAMEDAEIERRKTQEAEEMELLQAQRIWAEQDKERDRIEQAEVDRRKAEDAEEKRKLLERERQLQRLQQEQLVETENWKRYEAQQQKKAEKLLETALKGSQQWRGGKERRMGFEEFNRQEETQRIERHRLEEEQRRAERAEAEKQQQIQRVERQCQAEEQIRANHEKAEKQRKKEIKEQRRRSREQSNPPIKKEGSNDHKKHSQPFKRVVKDRFAIEDQLADASAAAQERAPPKQRKHKVSKVKQWHDRSSSSLRRSEVGDTLRMARERERKAIAPSVIRPEFVRSMNAKQHEALINRARKSDRPNTVGPSRSFNVPLLSIEK